MAAIVETLVPPHGATERPPICALQGMAGAGKTYLAERFFWEHGDAFPGGRRRLALQPDQTPSAATLLGELAAELDAPAANPATLCARLRAPRALVHVDNIDDEAAAEAAADLADALPGCALVITGRYGALGHSGGWTVVEVAPFDEATAVAQLAAEFRAPKPHEHAAFANLARELGHLPLALTLAAAHLREGLSPEQFLALLREVRLDIDHPDKSAGDRDKRRRNLHKTLTLSLDLLQRSLGARGEELLSAFHALAHAPAAGFGTSLGAAITGLPVTDFLNRLARPAARLSVLDRTAAEPPRWRLHSLLAELLQPRTRSADVLERITAWFLVRLPRKSDDDPRPQTERWTEVHAETAALVDWLGRISVGDAKRVLATDGQFAMICGPHAAWIALCERVCEQPPDRDVQSEALLIWSYAAQSLGDLETSLRLAIEKEALDRQDERKQGRAIAAGLQADVLEARGQLDEALRIRKQEQLPVFEQLGDIRARAVTLGKIADILQARGQLDEALRIRKRDQLPVFEQLGDIRARAVTLGKIADILQAHGQLDEALHIRNQDELPVFEQLGDIRARAVTLGKIADILKARGQLDEALRIRKQDQLPVFEQLGDRRERLVCQAKIAVTLLARAQGTDRNEAGRLLRLALAAADDMRLPEAEQIRGILRRHGLGE